MSHVTSQASEVVPSHNCEIDRLIELRNEQDADIAYLQAQRDKLNQRIELLRQQNAFFTNGNNS